MSVRDDTEGKDPHFIPMLGSHSSVHDLPDW